MLDSLHYWQNQNRLVSRREIWVIFPVIMKYKTFTTKIIFPYGELKVDGYRSRVATQTLVSCVNIDGEEQREKLNIRPRRHNFDITLANAMSQGMCRNTKWQQIRQRDTDSTSPSRPQAACTCCNKKVFVCIQHLGVCQLLTFLPDLFADVTVHCSSVL